MGLLFIFLIGICAIILIARLASKTRPKEERLLVEAGGDERRKNGKEHYPEKNLQDKTTLEEGLLSLLIKKGVITEEELLLELELIKKLKEGN